ncbi:hypothetical protein AHAS_Ahas20G0093900 [Arachis hypogaea]
MDLREDILSLVHISASGRDLGWSWEHTLYSAKQGYLWLIQNKLNWDRNINWLWLWKARVPEKLRLLVWLCLHDTGIFGSAGSIAYKAGRCMVDFEYTTQNRVCCIQGLKSLSWSPPEPGAWKLNCDGSVNLGDDYAGFGWCHQDGVVEYMERFGLGLGGGLKLVVCETDCASAFELVTSWQVPLWHLEKEVIQLIFDLKLRRDWDIRFELIPREANVVADRLAKMRSGGSGADEVHLWHQPPELILSSTPQLITLVQQNCQFQKFSQEESTEFLAEFLQYADTVYTDEVDQDVYRLLLFSFAVKDQVKRWLDNQPKSSLKIWSQLVDKFLNQYFPPKKLTQLRLDIQSFKQGDNESLYDAWMRYKMMLRKCPNEIFSE